MLVLDVHRTSVGSTPVSRRLSHFITQNIKKCIQGLRCKKIGNFLVHQDHPYK